MDNSLFFYLRMFFMGEGLGVARAAIERARKAISFSPKSKCSLLDYIS